MGNPTAYELTKLNLNMEATNKTERFADFINVMSFSEVIRFFNSVSESYADSEEYTDWDAMYDYNVQEDAEWMIKAIGIKAFLNGVNNPTEEERAYLCDVRHGCELFVNPWEETLEHSEDFIKVIENSPKGHYEDAKKAINPKVIVKVAVHKTLTRIVEVEARSHAEAEEWIAKNFEKCDPLMKCDSIGGYFTEILPN